MKKSFVVIGVILCALIGILAVVVIEKFKLMKATTECGAITYAIRERIDGSTSNLTKDSILSEIEWVKQNLRASGLVERNHEGDLVDPWKNVINMQLQLVESNWCVTVKSDPKKAVFLDYNDFGYRLLIPVTSNRTSRSQVIRGVKN